MLITIFDLTPLIFDLHHPSQWKTGNKKNRGEETPQLPPVASWELGMGAVATCGYIAHRLIERTNKW